MRASATGWPSGPVTRPATADVVTPKEVLGVGECLPLDVPPPGTELAVRVVRRDEPVGVDVSNLGGVLEDAVHDDGAHRDVELLEP